jgi:hypothetical protein
MTTEEVKAVFERHGGDLQTVVASTYLELIEKVAALEERIAILERRGKK